MKLGNIIILVLSRYGSGRHGNGADPQLVLVLVLVFKFVFEFVFVFVFVAWMVSMVPRVAMVRTDAVVAVIVVEKRIIVRRPSRMMLDSLERGAGDDRFRANTIS
jgi:hypothetical protein